MEIERKFLFSKLPEHLASYPHYYLEQAYVTTNPVIRIRKKISVSDGQPDSQAQFILTVKGNGMLTRQEFELPIDEIAYQTLCQKSDGNLIAKTRYKIPLESNLVLELDLFEGLFQGLVMGEIEFPDEATAKGYLPPETLHIKEEVTYDTRFHNSTMSTMSKEEITVFLQTLKS